jgi:hypothetical protein
VDNNDITINLNIYESIKSSMILNQYLPHKVNILEDYRFQNRRWLCYFNKLNVGMDINLDIIIEIIK